MQITKEDAIREAHAWMRLCQMHMANDCTYHACMCFGSAQVYEDMLIDQWDCWLEDEDAEYSGMVEAFDRYLRAVKVKETN